MLLSKQQRMKLFKSWMYSSQKFLTQISMTIEVSGEEKNISKSRTANTRTSHGLCGLLPWSLFISASGVMLWIFGLILFFSYFCRRLIHFEWDVQQREGLGDLHMQKVQTS